MENIIAYYYNLNPEKYKENGDVIIIESHGELYIARIIKDKDVFTKIVSSINSSFFYKPILNRTNGYFFEYNNQTYALFKAINPAVPRYDDFIIIESIESTEINYSSIWEHNIEYFIKQLTSLDFSNTEEITNINYYIGLAENAITMNELANKLTINARKCLSHYRIKYPNYNLTYNDPTELLIDYISRDIAEYTKSKFFLEGMSVEEFMKLINKYKLNDKELLYVFARLLYPNYYFDLLSEKNTDKQQKIIEKRKKYEKFLSNIFEQIKTTTLYVNISWLK
ncbi:MAG: hypothetical protein J1F35_07325 [Erysipelotrichales bacterium]|nr:hypothetical protein [Erysipelotrichales bacterium]